MKRGATRRDKLMTRKKELQALSATIARIDGSLSSRSDLGSSIGRQYGTATGEYQRDLYQALGYPLTTSSIQLKDYIARYARQDIAKAIIDRPVRATWTGGVRLTEAGEVDKTPFEKAWDDLVLEHTLDSKFLRLDKLTGLGHYGVLLLGFDDTSDKIGMLESVKPGKRKLLYVKPLSESSATVLTWENNPSSARYGLPLTYQVAIIEASSDNEIKMDVHYTRILHVADDLDESEVKGTPRLLAVWNRLMDLEKIMGGSAEMFWRGARPGYAAEVHPDAQFTDDDLDELEDQLDEYDHHLRRVLILQSMKMTPLAMQVADPTAHVDIQIQAISAITGIPKRILTGSERGELASTEDRSAWQESIKTRRNMFAEPQIVRAFANRMIEYGILPKPKTGKYGLAWEDPFAPSAEDKAKIGEIQSRAISYYANAMGARDIIPPEQFLEFIMGLTEDEVKLIAAAAEEYIAEEEEAFRDLEEEMKKRQAKLPTVPEEE